MKGAVSTAILSLLGASSCLAWQSQEEKDKEKEKPPRQEQPRKQEEPRRQEEPSRDKDRPGQEPDRKPEPPDRNKQPDRKPQDRPDQDRTRQEQDRTRQEQDRTRQENERRSQEPQRKDRNHVEQNQAARENGGPHGRRIPEDRFRASFGREHRFHIHREGGRGGNIRSGGDQRFQYAGYWFEYTEVWPAGWSYDDDFYIEYIDDDYYLFDEEHPRIRILVFIVE